MVHVEAAISVAQSEDQKLQMTESKGMIKELQRETNKYLTKYRPIRNDKNIIMKTQ